MRAGDALTIAGRPRAIASKLIGIAVAIGLVGASWLGSVGPVEAQGSITGWDAGISLEKTVPATEGTGITVVPRSEAGSASPGATAPEDPSDGKAKVRLIALLTADGQRIDRGIVWRVFRETEEQGNALKLVTTSREAIAEVALEAGAYIVNAAFGRANLTRTISVEPGVASTEQFVINAGGLRLTAMVGKSAAPANAVTYDIFEGEQRQTSERALIMSAARPGLIIRLNSGIYHIVSTYGDGNAKVAADVTVEAGKLTEVALAHAVAKVTMRLVTRPGGEALPDTQWQISTRDGHVVKRSVGALPTHVLAPGAYTVTATNAGRSFEQPIEIKDGEMAKVEVMIK